ncbi:IS110 family transposase [Streptomyces sp. NPDC050263]|uniref:IS110 family transposase n=1 Tax=Streptomyces sp. NPDC050263 TaxID=3155037 RepID=UPI0034499255
MSPFRPALDLLDTIPGVNQAVAEVIVAETGGDMTRFRSAQHLASWAGLCPGHHESAGRVRSTGSDPATPVSREPSGWPRSERHGPRAPSCGHATSG